MTGSRDKQPEHLLIYEPRTEGHHLGWLRFITEDFLSAGLRLTIAVDPRPDQTDKIKDNLEGLLSSVSLVKAGSPGGQTSSARKVSDLARCLRESGAASAFLGSLDEVASSVWRRAAFGLYPPTELRGRIGGIYHRPRFLALPATSPRRWLKFFGFQRLLKLGWFRQILLLDEYLARRLRDTYPAAPIGFLPGPCPTGTFLDGAGAREQLGIPAGRRVFLFYGGGYWRKGLHLAVQAMGALPADSPAFLLCAGQLKAQGATALELQKLIREKRAKLIDRYVTMAEEAACFSVGEFVLLPYIHHFGTSAVLFRAMAETRMVIASDEELLGRLTRDHGLGLCFATGNSTALRDCMRQALALSPDQLAQYSANARKYAKAYSRAAYRQALVGSLAQPGTFQLQLGA